MMRATETKGMALITGPRNSPTGFVTAFFAVVTSFALIWRIWWMASRGLLASLRWHRRRLRGPPGLD
jgi:cytochrome o ubiquinol oxidase subunit 1